MSITGIVLNNRRMLHRIAYRIETALGSQVDGVDIGPGVHETRPEFRTTITRTQIANHPNNGQCALVFLFPNARARFAAFLAAAQAKAAGARDADETVAVALPAEAAQDATWDSFAPP